MSVMQMRMFRDALDAAVAFAEGRGAPTSQVASREPRGKNPNLGISHEVTVIANADGVETVIKVESNNIAEDCNSPHEISYVIGEKGRGETGRGGFSLMHADMLDLREAVDRAIEFYEREGLPDAAAFVEKHCPEKRELLGYLRAGESVSIPRETAEAAAQLMLEFFECCVSSTFDWDDIPGSIRRGLAALHAAKCSGNGDALRDYPVAVVDARNYVALMRALGKGEGLPDVDELVNELKYKHGRKAKKGEPAK